MDFDWCCNICSWASESSMGQMQWISLLPSSGECTVFHQHILIQTTKLFMVWKSRSMSSASKGSYELPLVKGDQFAPLYSFSMNSICKITTIPDRYWASGIYYCMYFTTLCYCNIRFCLKDQLNKHLTGILVVLELEIFPAAKWV